MCPSPMNRVAEVGGLSKAQKNRDLGKEILQFFISGQYLYWNYIRFQNIICSSNWIYHNHKMHVT